MLYSKTQNQCCWVRLESWVAYSSPLLTVPAQILQGEQPQLPSGDCSALQVECPCSLIQTCSVRQETFNLTSPPCWIGLSFDEPIVVDLLVIGTTSSDGALKSSSNNFMAVNIPVSLLCAKGVDSHSSIASKQSDVLQGHPVVESATYYQLSKRRLTNSRKPENQNMCSSFVSSQYIIQIQPSASATLLNWAWTLWYDEWLTEKSYCSFPERKL